MGKYVAPQFDIYIFSSKLICLGPSLKIWNRERTQMLKTTIAFPFFSGLTHQHHLLLFAYLVPMSFQTYSVMICNFFKAARRVSTNFAPSKAPERRHLSTNAFKRQWASLWNQIFILAFDKALVEKPSRMGHASFLLLVSIFSSDRWEKLEISKKGILIFKNCTLPERTRTQLLLITHNLKICPNSYLIYNYNLFTICFRSIWIPNQSFFTYFYIYLIAVILSIFTQSQKLVPRIR